MKLNHQQILKELGLHEHEATVYIELLKLGPSPASLIAKDSSLKRTTVYPILKELAKKGFVSIFYKNKKRLYRAQQPQKLSNFFQKRLERFNSIIPSLKSLEKKQAQVLGLQFIETLDELKQFYTQVLVEYKNQEYYIIGSATAWEGLDPEFFIQFRKDRGEASIRTKLLLTDESQSINPIDPALLREFVFLPTGYEFKSTIDIYPDKVLVVSPELSSLAVVIAVPIMTDVFKTVFELLWDLLSPKKKIEF
jgi:predicted transcriptional regulator